MTAPVAVQKISHAARLHQKLQSKTARVGVIGMGYVGLPLALTLAKAGFEVTGIDILRKKIDALASGISPIVDVPSSTLASLVRERRFIPTAEFSAISGLDTVSICVPTPLRKTKDPDMSYIDSASRAISKHLHSSMLIILESTTYPGTTTEFVLPIFQESGLVVGSDFFLAFSPERVDPGNDKYHTANIPKVVGGVTRTCTELSVAFYSQAIQTVMPVGSPHVAEMVKLLENTFRMINIGLVNEIALMCNRMDIDVWEVIEAAATKPFGFMPFYPGPGLGGHCIPIDPFYLSWKSKQAGIEARFIELAGYINGQMPHFVVGKIQDALNSCRKPVNGSHVHVLGVAYKRDIDDVRESPAIDIMLLLERRGAHVTYSDPHVGSIKLNRREISASDSLAMSAVADCVVVITEHTLFDYHGLLETSKLIVDTRNAFKGFSSSKIVRL